MNYAVYKGETNLKDLVTRLFQLPDRTAATMKRSQDELLLANPQLSDLSKVRAGSVIVIPRGAPPLKPSEVAPASVARQFAVTVQSEEAVFKVSGKLEDLNQTAARAARNFLIMLQSEQAKAIAEKSAELKEEFPELLNAAQAFAESTKSVRSEHVLAKFLSAVQPHRFHE